MIIETRHIDEDLLTKTVPGIVIAYIPHLADSVFWIYFRRVFFQE
jgi:hypothetical protein